MTQASERFFSVTSRRQHLFIIAVVSLATFFSVVNNGFVWDDAGYLLSRSALRNFDLVTIFTSAANSIEYLPVRDLTSAIDFLVWGESPWGHHLTSLVIHVISGLLAYLLAEEVVAVGDGETFHWQQAFVPLATGLLVALHPLQAQAVSWVGCRNVILAGMFSFLATLLYLKFLSSGSRKLYLWGVVIFVCAMLSKATAIILVLLLTLASLYRPAGKKITEHLLYLAPFWVLTAVFYFVHTGVAFNNRVLSQSTPETLLSRVAVSVQIPWFYIAKFIFPANLSPEYDIAFPQRFSSPIVIAAVAGLLALTTVVVVYRRKEPLLFFGMAWFFLSLIPVLKIFVASTIVADRYCYIPIFGLSLALSSVVGKLAGERGRAAVSAGLLLLVSLFAVLSFRESLVWSSDETLFRRGIEASPTNGKHYSNLGLYYFRRKMYDKAFPLLDKARMTTYSRDYYSYCKAELHIERKEYPEAIAALEKALWRNDKFDLALMKLGETYEAVGDFESAFAQYSKLLTLDWFVPWEVRERAEKLRNRLAGKINGELDLMRGEVAAAPENLRLRGELALKLDRLMLYEEALKEYKALESHGMKGWELHYNIGNVLMKLKRFGEAARSFQACIAYNRNNKDAYNNLGIAFKELKDYQRARDAFEQVLSLDPHFAMAQFNLANVYYLMGRHEDAKRLATKLFSESPEMKAKVGSFLVQ
ncbi:transmembrane and TPR repeat-containing protein F38B6.6 [Geobacter sp. OR-1]|uniref:tetratricopeptide repeat protein n=1 Tax=Geobacter sp. OR-1 TaxID=1266765 RepID=UPI000542383E|nr:tetratricopeptide repeat protein [Geobacter sp. OR-1]GAM08951.1 transmembrane and TPR repeat-containing protein F38B6.6 [Geobacter sp. OR-1]